MRNDRAPFDRALTSRFSLSAILIPAGYNAAFSATTTSAVEASAILSMSRGTSIILLFIYGAYRKIYLKARTARHSTHVVFPPTVIFQLFTHQHLYLEGATEDTDHSRPIWGMGDRRALRNARSTRQPRLATVEDGQDEEEDEEEIPQLSLYAALVLLIAVTVRLL